MSTTPESPHPAMDSTEPRVGENTDTLTFSYTNDTVFSFLLPNGVHMKLRADCPSIARLYFENDAGEVVAAPAEISIKDISSSTLVSLLDIRRVQNIMITPNPDTKIFFMSACDEFSIFFGDQIIVNMQPTKTWTLRTLYSQPMEKSHATQPVDPSAN